MMHRACAGGVDCTDEEIMRAPMQCILGPRLLDCASHSLGLPAHVLVHLRVNALLGLLRPCMPVHLQAAALNPRVKAPCSMVV